MRRRKAYLAGVSLLLAFYCPLWGMGEKPSPLGENFSMLAVWRIIGNPAIPFMT